MGEKKPKTFSPLHNSVCDRDRRMCVGDCELIVEFISRGCGMRCAYCNQPVDFGMLSHKESICEECLYIASHERRKPRHVPDECSEDDEDELSRNLEKESGE